MDGFTIIGNMMSDDLKNYTSDLKKHLSIVPSRSEMAREKRISTFKKLFIFIGRSLKMIAFLFLISLMFFNLFLDVDSFSKEDNLKNILIFLSFSVLIYIAFFRMKERTSEDIFTHTISDDGVVISNDIEDHSVSWGEISQINVLESCMIFEVKKEKAAEYPFIPIRFFKDRVEIDKVVSYCQQKIKQHRFSN